MSHAAGPAYEKELNPEQLAAVMAPDGPALVLAAAGTGKTRTLVYRVARLVGRGVEPGHILLLTFTNRAAREMLERATAVAGAGVGGIWGGTFHHMANRILRRHASQIGFRSDYAILDQDDSRSLVAEAAKRCGVHGKEFPKPEVLASLFSAAVNTRADLAVLVGQRLADTAVSADDVARVQRAYEERKRALGAMDFDDLLVHCLRLFQEQPAVAERYRQQFVHVLVDEYQDTNAIQADLVDAVGAQHRNVLVVGDDFQSIYAWRGADFRNILSFPERYPDARIYKLETNYRSVPEILAVANVCIAGNPEQFQKTLRPTRPRHHRPLLLRVRSGDEQAMAVIGQVTRLRREGYRLSDIAVLYRAHFHAMELQVALTHERLPHIVTSGVRFFEQAHVKDACSLVRLMANPADELAFERLLALLPGVGPKTAEKVWLKLRGRFDLRDGSQRSTVAEALGARSRPAWTGLAPVFDRAAISTAIDNAADTIGAFVETFYREYAENAFENADTRLEDVEELTTFLGRFGTIEAFLSDVALLTNMDAEQDALAASGTESLRLSTVHQAKGLEWPAVIVLWLTDGMFPSSRSMSETEGGEAEERRLFYVAVTRAKDELCLCVPEWRRNRDGTGYYCPPSRFIDEIPAKLLEERRVTFC